MLSEVLKEISKKHSSPIEKENLLEIDRVKGELEIIEFENNKRKFLIDMIGCLLDRERARSTAKSHSYDYSDAKQKLKAMDNQLTKGKNHLPVPDRWGFPYDCETVKKNLDNMLSIGYKTPKDLPLVLTHFITLILFYKGIKEFPEYADIVLMQKADFTAMKLVQAATFLLSASHVLAKRHDQRSMGARRGKQAKKQKWGQAIIETYHAVKNRQHTTKSGLYRAILKEMEKRPDVKKMIREGWALPSPRTIKRRLEEDGIDLANVGLPKKIHKI